MGPTFWTFVIVVVVPLTTYATTRMTLNYTDQREEARLEHERFLKITELQHQRQDKRREECVAAYRTLLTRARRINYKEPYEFIDLTEADLEVQLVSESPLAKIFSSRLAQSCAKARKAATDAYKKDPTENIVQVPGVKQAIDENDAMWKEFMEQAIEDRRRMSELIVHVPDPQPREDSPSLAYTLLRVFMRNLPGADAVRRQFGSPPRDQ